MPYIVEEKRDKLHCCSCERSRMSLVPGELNYLFTTIIRDYIKQQGLCYQSINDILGALEGAKQEFYRRVAIPYEDKKKEENGDVF